MTGAQVVEHRQHVVGPGRAGDDGQAAVFRFAAEAPELVDLVDHDPADEVDERGPGAGGPGRRFVLRLDLRDLLLVRLGGVPVALGCGLPRVAGELGDLLVR